MLKCYGSAAILFHQQQLQSLQDHFVGRVQKPKVAYFVKALGQNMCRKRRKNSIAARRMVFHSLLIEFWYSIGCMKDLYLMSVVPAMLNKRSTEVRILVAHQCLFIPKYLLRL